MSATAFFREHAPGADFQDFMAKKHEVTARGSRPRSIIGALGEAIAQSGTDGLNALAYRKEARGIALLPQPETQVATSADGEREFGAVITGVSIMAVEQMIFDAYFDRQEFIDDINVRLTNADFGNFTFPEPDKRLEAISVGDHNQMIEFAIRHPTLTEFFLERDLQYLPPAFRSTLLKSDHPITKRPFMAYVLDILPEYFELANALTQAKEPEPLDPAFDRTVRVYYPKAFHIQTYKWAYRHMQSLKFPDLESA